MARTIPTTHINQSTKPYKPGAKIQLGNTGAGTDTFDLSTLNQAINRGMMANLRDVVAYGITRKGIAETAASYSSRYHGHVYLPFVDDRVRLLVYGQNCIIRLSIDGNVITTVTCTASLGWYSSAQPKLSASGASNPQDGMVLLVEGQEYNETDGTHYCVLVEQPSSSTSTTDLDTFMAGTRTESIDDAAFDADTALTAFLGQRLSNNAHYTAAIRTPGVCMMHPAQEQHLLSSTAWRADGPYTIMVPPYCDAVTVTLTCDALDDGTVDQDMYVSVFIEGEDLDDVLKTTGDGGRSVTISPASVTRQEFADIKIPNRNGEALTMVNFYVAFRSEIDSVAVTSSLTLAGFYTSGQLAINTNFQSLIPNTHGRAIRMEVFSKLQGEAVKPVQNYGVGYAYKDLAGAEFQSGSPIWYSPSNIKFPLPDESGNQNNVDIFPMGILRVYGVTAIAVQTDATLYNETLFAPGTPPQGGIIKETVQLTNDMTSFGAPMLAIRHHGNTWMADSANSVTALSGDRIGRWMHVVPDADYTDILVVPIPRRPNAASGLTSTSFLCQAQYFAVDDSTVDSVVVAPTLWRCILTSDPLFTNGNDTAGIIGSAGTVRSATPTLIKRTANGRYGEFCTVWDAVQTVTMKQARDTGNNDYDHAYTAQVCWPSEVIKRRPWEMSPICDVAVNATTGNYPLFLKFQARITEGNANLCIVGAHAWLGTRV